MTAEPLRVLFFVEPLIESLDLNLRHYWAHTFATRLLKALGNNTQANVDVRLMTNEFLAASAPDFNPAAVITVTQAQLRAQHMDFHSEAVLTQACAGTLPKSECTRLAAIYKAALGNFIPDIILTWTPAPYLQEAYPAALLLHTEAGMFSLFPFPQTTFFDPVGCPHPAYVIAALKELALTAPLPAESQWNLDRLKNLVSTYLQRSAWKDDQLTAMRERYPAMVLLTLPMFGNYVTKRLLGNMSMVDFILNAVSTLPANVGIVITEHPIERILPKEFIAHLQKYYPNVYTNPDWRKSSILSDCLLPWVDLVLHVGSKIGFMATLCGKKVIDLSNVAGHDGLADGSTIEDVERVLQHPPVYRDHIIHWMLTHYTLSWETINKPGWFLDFLQHSLEHKRRGGLLKDFYRPVASEDLIYDYYIETLMANVGTKAA